MEFYQNLVLAYRQGGYLFVHAGIRPGKPIDAQKDQDLLWIRNEFLEDRRALPVIVVHGHSPDMEPYADHRRIGVDTGAYATGKLTAVRLEDEKVDWLYVTRADIKSE
jgi:serine/threonine protein phosphatase 1